MIKLPFILIATAIMGIFSSQAIPLPEKFAEFRPDALLAFVALAILVFAYLQQKNFTDTVNRLVEKMDSMPCLLNRDAIKDIFQQQKQEKIT